MEEENKKKNKHYWQLDEQSGHERFRPAVAARERSVPLAARSCWGPRGSQRSRLGLLLPQCHICNKLYLPLCEVMKSWRGGEPCADGKDALSAFFFLIDNIAIIPYKRPRFILFLHLLGMPEAVASFPEVSLSPGCPSG